MNKRIQELAEQCGFMYHETVGLVAGPNASGVKFAELIIQDIINNALIQARWYQEVEKDDNTVVALCDLVKDIREEYGVE